MLYSDKSLFFFILLVTCLGSPPGICEDAGDPVPVKERQLSEVKGKESKKNAGVWFASFFRDVISPVDGDRCPSLPTCSSYSVSAFKKHGFFTGWLMTVDRLIHEGDEGSVSPRVYYKGRLRTLDPVENNDYWWFGEDESAQRKILEIQGSKVQCLQFKVEDGTVLHSK